MRVRVSPRQLAQQLPELRLDILQTYDDFLWIDGAEMDEFDRLHIKYAGSKEERYPILAKEPNFIKVFSEKELYVISFLYERESTVEQLSYEIYEDFSHHNHVHVLLKNIRRKLEATKIKYYIRKLGRPSFYRFKPVDN